ncbi:MAG: DUF1553 domain-containing protein, partial [Candidatus Hydrogenedentes bacterium]|nr:DUF1553 domain-containing protein [Candidatus Hydrogenedentota bacterium]
KSATLAKEITSKKLKGRPINLRIAKTFEGEAPKTMAEVTQRYGTAIREANKAWSDLLASYAQMAAKQPKNPPAPPTALKNGDLEAIRQLLYGADSPANISRGDVRGLSDIPIRNQMRNRDNAIARVKATHPGRPDRAMALVDAPKPFAPYVFRRGKPGNRGATVKRKYLDILTAPDAAPNETGSGRLEMANIIASHDNPLTARVMVNRIWMHHFGKALVSTPSDFGVRSDPPSHPALLDYLASEFMGGGWSIKNIHRLIMRSHTYQQASLSQRAGIEIDPGNRLLWRQNRQRLDFESMRDGVLLAAGRLDTTLGGEGQSMMAEPFMTRRTLYARIERQNLPPLFRTFDFANPDVHIPMRINTTVPQQALFLMNSPFLMEQARHLAERESVARRKMPEERISTLYHTVFQRDPDAEELSLGKQFIAAREGALPGEDPIPRWQYGYGPLDQETGLLTSFTPLPHFTGTTWQGGPKLPDPTLNWVSLHANGGHPGPHSFAAVRRWIAPTNMTVSITGKLKHGSPNGDGVFGYIISSSGALLWKGHAHNTAIPGNIAKIPVKAGEHIDFVLDCGIDQNSDSFTWHPRIRVAEGSSTEMPAGGKREWVAQVEFAGAPPPPAAPWEKYAQVLLMSNEFMFVD